MCVSLRVCSCGFLHAYVCVEKEVIILLEIESLFLSRYISTVLELSDPIFSGIDDDGNYVLTCKATGYPKATISWGIQDQDTNDMFVMGRTEFNVTSSIKLPSCDLNSISCTANAENLGNTRTTTNPCGKL